MSVSFPYFSGSVSFPFLFLRFFFGHHLPSCKDCSIGDVDSEEDLKNLAKFVSGGYASHISLFLVTETSFHDGCTQIPYYPSGCPALFRLILGSWPLTDKAGIDTLRGTFPAVVIGAVYLVGSDLFNLHPCQFLLIFQAVFQPDTLVECLEGKMFYKGDAVNLYVVTLRPELHRLVLLAPDNGTDIRTVDTYDSMAHLLTVEKSFLLSEYNPDCSQPFLLSGSKG